MDTFWNPSLYNPLQFCPVNTATQTSCRYLCPCFSWNFLAMYWLKLFFFNLHFEGLLKNGCLEVQEKSDSDVCHDNLRAGSLCWQQEQRHWQTKWEVKNFVPGHSLAQPRSQDLFPRKKPREKALGMRLSLALLTQLISRDFAHQLCSCCNAWEPADRLLSWQCLI